MANISSAYGKLTLNGNWTEEAVEALRPVLDAWEFYGEYRHADIRISYCR